MCVCSGCHDIFPVFIDRFLFQSVCEDVFLGKWLNILGGLLRNPPLSIKEQLFSILHTCAFAQTWQDDGVAIQKPSKDLLSKLYNLLQESLYESE